MILFFHRFIEEFGDLPEVHEVIKIGSDKIGLIKK